MVYLSEMIEDERGFLASDALNKKLVYEKAKIQRAFIGKWETPCTDGTEAQTGLNLEIEYDSLGGAALCLSDEEHIRKFLERMGVKKVEELNEKQVDTYNIKLGDNKYQTKLVGICEPRRI